MSYGDGSVKEFKRKDGKSFNPKHWRITLSYTVEEKQADGTVVQKRKRVTRVCEGTKAEAKEYRDQLLAEYDSRGEMKDEVARENEKQAIQEGTTLSEFIQTWNAVRATTGKANERTLKEDLTRLRHVEDFLGNTLIKDITPQMIDVAYAKIRTEHGLSGTTLNHIHILLKNVFSKAIDYDIIVKNPCAKVDAPKVNTPDRKALKENEGKDLLKKINEAESKAYREFDEKEDRMHRRGKDENRSRVLGLRGIGYVMAARIGLATGMRRNEVLALTWKNVNLEGYAITVCQSMDIKGTIKSPKTKAGIRTLAIDAETTQHLLTWKARQKAELEKIGVKQIAGTPVCCTDIGGFTRPDNFEHWWSKWRKANGFEGLKFHELRHTQATILLSNKVDLKTVQTRMGHANPSITLGWYAHAIPENDHEAAQMLGNIFGGTEQTDVTSEQKNFECHTNVTPEPISA